MRRQVLDDDSQPLAHVGKVLDMVKDVDVQPSALVASALRAQVFIWWVRP